MIRQALFLLSFRFRQIARGAQEAPGRAAFRTAILGGTATILWIGLYFFFKRGLDFLADYLPEPDLQDMTHGYLFGTFFLVMFLMLMVSNAILVYGALFRSRETAFLLAEPIRSDSLYLYKLGEALAFSSWAFALLGSPLLVAYGVSTGRSIAFYPLVAALLPPFLLLSAAIGGLAALALVRYVPRRRRQVLAVLAGILCVAIVLLLLRVFREGRTVAIPNYVWLQRFFVRIEFARSPVWPSSWLDQAVRAADVNAGAYLFYLLELMSQTLFFLWAGASLARRVLVDAFSRVQGRSDIRGQWLPTLLGIPERIAAFILRPFPSIEGALILKDIRGFLRDPVQWVQFLLFFGLLGIYFGSLRSLPYDLENPYWQNLLSFLNLSSCCFTLATFTSRFVYPLLSLEGNRLWVLGLAPIHRRRIVLAKFAFSAVGALAISVPLILLSDGMLRVPAGLIGLHLYMAIGVSLGLSGISVGLGAFAPNLREDNPARIVSGFGGVVNLLISLLFVLFAILSIAVPSHWHQVQGGILTGGRLPGWLAASLLVTTAGFVVATWVPMWAGIRRFVRMEM